MQTGHKCQSFATASQQWLDPFIKQVQYMQCLIAKVWQIQWLTTLIRNYTLTSDQSQSLSCRFPPNPFRTIYSNDITHVLSFIEPSPKTHFSSIYSRGLSPLQISRFVRIATEQVFLGRFLAKQVFIMAASQQIYPLAAYMGANLDRSVLGNQCSLTLTPWKKAFAHFLILFSVSSVILQQNVAMQMIYFSLSMWFLEREANSPKPCPSSQNSYRLSPG